jgi:TFIIH basal transcription factor complex TTD-A subunit
VLVQCDPSIKAIILKIDSRAHEIVIEDLDDDTLMVKETKLVELKTKLDLVGSYKRNIAYV